MDNGRIEKRSGLFATFHSGRECTLAKANDTPSEFAAQVIQAICYLVYEPGTGEQENHNDAKDIRLQERRCQVGIRLYIPAVSH